MMREPRQVRLIRGSTMLPGARGVTTTAIATLISGHIRDAAEKHWNSECGVWTSAFHDLGFGNATKRGERAGGEWLPAGSCPRRCHSNEGSSHVENPGRR